MKRFYASILALFLGLSLYASPLAGPGYNIRIKVKGWPAGSKCMLAYHYGDKQYIKDTTLAAADGWFTFKADSLLPQGVYLAVMPDNKWFEIMVEKSQVFTMETDTFNLVDNMKVTGSAENQVFFDYQRAMNKKMKESQALDEKLKADSTNKNLKKSVDAEKDSINAWIKRYRDDLKVKYPGFLITKILNMMEDPVYPEYKEIADTIQRKQAQYRYFKSHYFDNFDWADDRLLRTPVFHPRLVNYFKRTILQIPDSIIPEVDFVLGMAQKNKEVFKYTLITLFNMYVENKQICMENVYYHLAKNYYLTPMVDWSDTSFIRKTNERVRDLERCRCGQVATELMLQDSMSNTIPLSGVRASFVLMPFWDPNCGHCQKEMPRLAEVYDSLCKIRPGMRDSVKVYAVCIKREDPKDPGKGKEEFKKFIREKKMGSFINVWDEYVRNDFRHWYDVYSTPVMYLLDKDKKIIAKRFGLENLPDLLINMMDELNQKK